MRCAIYTRKSSAEGLERPFNSLDAQRLACSHYIASQASEGWIERDVTYNDGGYSGGTLNRPGLQHLLRDVENGLIDMVVVYKIDRLSRSLRDFVRLLELFERHAVTFAAVTQQFTTTSSMGRLTLNILLAFAQFERELTSERTRDKFAALRSKGMRPQGGRPFGYQFNGRRLEVDDAEAAIVTRIFASFIRSRSCAAIPAALNRTGLLNHRGLPFTLPFIRRLLRNRLYCGDIVHRGQSTPGAHPPIISERVWAKAQALIAPRAAAWNNRIKRAPGMLAGLLFGPTGALLHESGISSGKVYRYYGPPKRLRRGVPRCESGRFRAAELEDWVMGVLDPDGHLSRDLTSETAAAELVRSLVQRIEIGHDIAVRLKTGHTVTGPKEPWLSSSRLRRRVLVLPAPSRS